MNTHSKWADCRMELFCAHAAIHGAGEDVCRALMDAATADAAIAILDRAKLRQAVLQSLLRSVQHHLSRRVGESLRVGAITFSNEYGLLGQTETVEEILSQWKKS